MNVTPIQWTTFSANPLKYRAPDGRVVWACEKLSPGCTNCYAESRSHRYGGARRAGDWNAGVMATLTPFLDEAELHKMLTARTIGGMSVSGSKCFVGDMTDIFGEWVPDDLLDQLFAVFALRPDVTWQVLTKRAERMRAYFAVDRTVLLDRIDAASDEWTHGTISDADWPLKNVWLGVSVENQHFADERIPLLLQTPAAVRFISAEPLLGEIDLHSPVLEADSDRYLDWVIVGGESGRCARPCCLSWIRNIVHDCAEAKVACFVKQLGARPHETTDDDGADGECTWPIGTEIRLKDSHGGDPKEWPAHLRVRQFPEVARD